VLTTPHPKNWPCYEVDSFASAYTNLVVRHKQWKRDMRFGTLNVRLGSFTTVARELARYKLGSVNVQKFRSDKGGTVRAGDYNFC
jgi:hypothetical protein